MTEKSAARSHSICLRYPLLRFFVAIDILFRAKEAFTNMLGDQIAEETGKIAAMRVLDAVGPKVEVSARTQGKALGIDYQGRTTYTSQVQPGGHIFGEGQGVYLTANGMATWKGQGTGKFNPGGGVSYRGTIHYVSAPGALAKLAGTVGVFFWPTR